MENKKPQTASNGKRNSDSSNSQRKGDNSGKDAEDNNQNSGTNSRKNSVDNGQPNEKPKSSRKHKSHGKQISELQRLVAKIEAFCMPDLKTFDSLHHNNGCAAPISRRVSACLYAPSPCHGATRNVFTCDLHDASRWPACAASQPARLGDSGRHSRCFGRSSPPPGTCPGATQRCPSPHRSRTWRTHHHRKRCQWQRPCRHRRALFPGPVPDVPADGLGLLDAGQPDPFRNLGRRLPFGVEPEELAASRAVISSCPCRTHTVTRCRPKRFGVSPLAGESAPKPKRRKKARRASESSGEGREDTEAEGTCPALGANFRCSAGLQCKCGMLAQGPYGESMGDSCPVLGNDYVCTGGVDGGVGGDVGGYNFNAEMEANPQVGSCPTLGPDYLCGDSNIMGQGAFQPYSNTDYVGTMASSCPILGPDYDCTADPNMTGVMSWQNQDQRGGTDAPCPILGTDYICGDSGARNAMQMADPASSSPCPFLGSGFACSAQGPQIGVSATGPCSCGASLQAGEAPTPCPILGTGYDCSGRSDIFQGMPPFEMQRSLGTGRQCTCGYQPPPDGGAGQACPILGSGVVCSAMGATNNQPLLPSEQPCPVLGSDVICSGKGGGVNEPAGMLASSGWAPSFGNLHGFGPGGEAMPTSATLGSDGVFPGGQAFSDIGNDAPCAIFRDDVTCTGGGAGVACGGGGGGREGGGGGGGEAVIDVSTRTTEAPCPILGPSVVCSTASLQQESKQDCPVLGPEMVCSGGGINSNAGYQPFANEIPSSTFPSRVSGTDCPCPPSPSCPPFVYVVPFEQPSMASYGRIQGFVVAFEESPRAPFKGSRMEPILSTKCSGVFSTTKTCSSTDPVLQLLDAKSETRASFIDSSMQTSRSNVSVQPSPYRMRKVGLATRSSLQTLWPNGSLGTSTPSGDISRVSLGDRSQSVSFGSSFWNDYSESTDRGTSVMRMPRDAPAAAKVRSLDSFRARRGANQTTTEFTTQYPSATELRTCQEIALGASGTSVCVVLKESSIQTSLQSIPETIAPSVARPSQSTPSKTKKPGVTVLEKSPELRTCEEIRLGASGISVCAYKETSIQTSSESIPPSIVPAKVRPSQIKKLRSAKTEERLREENEPLRPSQVKESKIKKPRPTESQETPTSPVYSSRVVLQKEIVPTKRKKKKKCKKVPVRDCSTQVDICECVKKATNPVSATKLKEKKEGNVSQASQTCAVVKFRSCTPKDHHRGSRSRKGKCESCGNPGNIHRLLLRRRPLLHPLRCLRPVVLLGRLCPWLPAAGVHHAALPARAPAHHLRPCARDAPQGVLPLRMRYLCAARHLRRLLE